MRPQVGQQNPVVEIHRYAIAAAGKHGFPYRAQAAIGEHFARADMWIGGIDPAISPHGNVFGSFQSPPDDFEFAQIDLPQRNSYSPQYKSVFSGVAPGILDDHV